jgi:N-methylhydantoinase B
VTIGKEATGKQLDPITFEVLKNAFGVIVDQMAEQILRTCHSFVIWSRDFSSALSDRHGNTVAQGSQDLAAHVGTLHFTGQAIIELEGATMKPGDVFALNDPYLGGTHFNDVRVVRPIFVDDELIALAQVNGHWADVGGGAPGSFDIRAHEHYGEGLRITPVKVWEEGRCRADLVRLLVANTRQPSDAEGDLRAQCEATALAERELVRLVARYGLSTVLAAFDEVQDYVERLTRARLGDLPDGTWETEDYMDQDPGAEEGLVPIRVQMSIQGDSVHYDLSGSAPCVHSFLNSAFGGSTSAVIAGTKTFFPEVPLNSGFYRAISVDLGPLGTVVNAPDPVAVTGFSAGPYEKIMNSVFELWSHVMPERAMACGFNLEYLLVGGRDGRTDARRTFMWYDWMAGGWGGRSDRDGCNATSPVLGVGLAVQPLEGQERLAPVLTTCHQILVDSAGPGRFRGGCGVEKGCELKEVEAAVVSYCCDRSRSITWGLFGGLPSLPHGVTLRRADGTKEYMGAVFSNVPVGPGDTVSRPSAGGGGLGDPLTRDPGAVLEDVLDGYVSVDRARKDYGVVVTRLDAERAEAEVDEDATRRERARIAAERRLWLEEDPASVAERFRASELDVLDCVRRYGVILDWGSGRVLPRTSAQFRAMLQRRTEPFWAVVPAGASAGSGE